MHNVENRIHLLHPLSDIWTKIAANSNGELFVTDFCDFYLVLRAFKDNVKCRDPNSCIIPITRDMDQ